MNRLYVLLICLVFVSSCVRSRYYTFQMPEIGATLMLEDNNSNTQRVFLCNESDVKDFDYLLSHSTILLAKKDMTCTLDVEVVSLSLSDAGSTFVFFNKQNGVQLIPYNSFVLNETHGIGTDNEMHHILLKLPLDIQDSLFHVQDSTIMVETIFNRHTQEKGLSRKNLRALPSFFTKERLLDNSPPFEVEPLENRKGFEYCGIQVETDLPFGEWGELSFFIDPSLPTFLFNDCINYRDKGTVRVSGQEIFLVETDMSLGCPGIRIVLNNRGIFIKKIE